MFTSNLEAEEAFIASSFVDFHTEKPASPGDWIPMTPEEAQERWDKWLAEHDASLLDFAKEEVAVILDEELSDLATRFGKHRIQEIALRICSLNPGTNNV